MLRFATITLSNPTRPGIPPVTVKAVVCEEDFALSLGPHMAERLQLPQNGLGDATEIGAGPRMLPQFGPVRVSFGGREVTTHALVGPLGVIVGRKLATELGIDASQQTEMPATAAAAIALRQENSPEKILSKEGMLDAATCRRFCDYAATQQPERATVVDAKKTTMEGVGSYVDLKSRDTFYIPTQGIDQQLKDIFFEVFTKHIEPFYGVEIEWWEMPQLLLYEPGGKYDAHTDAYHWEAHPGGGGHWQRDLDRDISVLLYLNEHFTGGALDFPDHKLTIQPKPGLLVAFPSSEKYRHGAQPTLTGERLVLVSWSKAKGTPRVQNQMPNVVYMSSMRKEQKQ